MSRTRKNIEYNRIPDEIESTMGANEAANHHPTNSGDIADATDREIQNVLAGVDGKDAVNVDQLNTVIGTIPDHSIYTLVDGTRAFSGDQSMGGNQLTNVGNPAEGTDEAMGLDFADARYSRLYIAANSRLLTEDEVLDGWDAPQTDLVIYTSPTFSAMGAPDWAKGPIIRIWMKQVGTVALSTGVWKAGGYSRMNTEGQMTILTDVSYTSSLSGGYVELPSQSDTSFVEANIYVPSPTPASTFTIRLTSGLATGTHHTWAVIDLIGWWG